MVKQMEYAGMDASMDASDFVPTVTPRARTGILSAPWWPYLLATVAAVLLRWPTLSNRMLTTDEPAYLLQAARLHSLDRFIYGYLYRTETKSPIGLIPYLVAQLIDPGNAILIVRVFVLLALLVSCWLLIAFARRFLGGPLPGLVAALISALYVATGSGYFTAPTILGEFWLGAKLEYFQLPFILACLYGVAWATGAGGTRPRHADWGLFGAGLAWAIAVLIKPGAILIGPVCLLSLLLLWSRARPWRARLPEQVRAGAAFLAGAALPVALVYVPYFLRPATLDELRFNLLDLNSSYAVGPPIIVRVPALLLGVPTVLLLLFLIAPVLVGRRLRGQPPTPAQRVLPLVLLAVPALFIGYLPGQALLHYLIPIVPLMALAVCGYLGLVFRDLARQGRLRLARALPFALALLYLAIQAPALLAYPGVAARDYYLEEDRTHFDLDGIVAYIKTHTAPTDPVWVYYDAPEINMLSGRPPATADPQADWLTFLWADPWFDRTLAALRAEPPKLIIGVNHPHLYFARAVPITEVSKVRTLVASDYRCDATLLRGAIICTRLK
jgi:hypothetical protein